VAAWLNARVQALNSSYRVVFSVCAISPTTESEVRAIWWDRSMFIISIIIITLLLA